MHSEGDIALVWDHPVLYGQMFCFLWFTNMVGWMPSKKSEGAPLFAELLWSFLWSIFVTKVGMIYLSIQPRCAVWTQLVCAPCERKVWHLSGVILQESRVTEVYRFGRKTIWPCSSESAGAAGLGVIGPHRNDPVVTGAVDRYSIENLLNSYFLSKAIFLCLSTQLACSFRRHRKHARFSPWRCRRLVGPIGQEVVARICTLKRF